MKPRRVNVDRMRRHVARTTPDVKRFTIDVANYDTWREWYEAELHRYSERMRIKHPEARAIDLRTWHDYPRDLDIVEARVRP